MFNIGAPELIVIAGIALIILGPEKFPTQAKVFLRMMREFRDHWDNAKSDIMREINPVKKEFRELRKYKPEELLDKLTGEDQEKTDETAKSPSDSPDGPGYPYAASGDAPAPGANEAPVEFESSTPPVSEGRSEETPWERKDEAASSPPTEENEIHSAESEYDIRPKDGSD